MNRSRREVIRIGGAATATVLAGGFAGCSELPGSGDGGDDGGQGSLSMVPAGVTAVARGDVTETLTDSAVETFVNEILGLMAQSEGYEGPTNKSEVLDRFQQETGLDLSKAQTAVGYQKYPVSGTVTPGGPQYAGLWFKADWSEDDLVSALENENMTLTEGEYSGKTIYQSEQSEESGQLGVLSSNTFVLGTKDSVEDAIDVGNGDMASLEGDLKSAYAGTRSAPFRFAANIPENQVPSGQEQVGDTSIDMSQFKAVNYVTGATYHEGDTVGIVIRMLTGSSDDAEDVRNMVAGGVSAAEGQLDNETLNKALDDIEVTQEETTVVAEASGSVDRAAELIKVLARFFVGLGPAAA